MCVNSTFIQINIKEIKRNNLLIRLIVLQTDCNSCTSSKLGVEKLRGRVRHRSVWHT